MYSKSKLIVTLNWVFNVCLSIRK